MAGALNLNIIRMNHNSEFANLLNSSFDKLYPSNSEAAKDFQPLTATKNQTSRDFIKTIYSRDNGLSSNNYDYEKLNHYIADSNSSGDYFFSTLRDSMMSIFVSNINEPLSLMQNEVAETVAGAFKNMLDSSVATVKLILEKTKKLRPRNDDKAQWDKYGAIVSKTFDNSKNFIKQFSKLKFGLFAKLLEKYGSYLDDISGENPAGFFNDFEFSSNDFDLARDSRSDAYTIKAKAGLPDQIMKSIENDPYVYKNPEKKEAMDISSNMIKRSKFFFQKAAELIAHDGNKIGGQLLIDECLDWLQRILNETLFKNLDLLYKDQNKSFFNKLNLF